MIKYFIFITTNIIVKIKNMVNIIRISLDLKLHIQFFYMQNP